ncbi:MAG: amidohydrolase family protein [candidate division Zixibacteria bacterium]|nr:amidohydrolase family protein [candidate division Zixibacteria bacterium]MCI0595973.1 amidohydrolase family protein [candidate division Zixibacteria bacterium]
MKKKFVLATVFCFFAVALWGFDQRPAPPQNHPVALISGTVHTVTGAELAGGTVLFDKGRITAIGRGVTLPPGTEVIDVTGKHVYPGLIDAFSNLGLTEIDAVRATNDVSETGRINPNARAEVAVNPESELIPVARANGITTALTAPEGGIISGTAALINLDGWTGEEMTFKAPVALIVNWPQMTPQRAWWVTESEEEQKKNRERNLKELAQAFKDARAYWTAKKAAVQNGKNIPTDMRWEAMVPVLDGKLPVLVMAQNLQQIQAAAAWAEEEKIKIIIGGGADAWRAAGLLKAKNIPVLVGGTLRTPSRRHEDYDMPFTLPAKLQEAGIKFAIYGGGWASNERNLPYHAAMASAYGLPKDAALKAITLFPAEIFGVADRIGSLEVGKDATLIVTTGDPLEITSNVEMEFIQGKKIDLTSRHTQLFEKYKAKYEQKPPANGRLRAGENEETK